MTLSDKYKIIGLIGEGAFGKVYKGQHNITKELVAIKIEEKGPVNTLIMEAKIYQHIGNIKGFPSLKWFETNTRYNILVINYLGKSLYDSIQLNKSFELKRVLQIGTQIIERLRVLHSKQMIHRDIKPHNLLFGHKDTNIVYLVDFTFAKRYINSGKHIKELLTNKIIGSLNFVSLNVHRHLEPSRRDDIISAIYVLMYLYYGKLEWENCTNENSIIMLKENLLTNTSNNIFLQLLNYAYNLAFSQEPNYEYIVSLLSNYK